MINNLLIIIPVFNEEASIENVVNNIINHYLHYDYIIINDGSTNKSSSICHKNNYHVIDLPENLGLSGAIQTDFKYAYCV